MCMDVTWALMSREHESKVEAFSIAFISASSRLVVARLEQRFNISATGARLAEFG